MDGWLIEQTAARRLQDAAHFKPSALDISNFESRNEGEPGILSVSADGTAEIRIDGVLTKQPNIIAALFGGGNTTYADIISALGFAQADPKVSRAVLAIDSPGGDVDGLFDTVAAIESFKEQKPIRTVANQAQSAAFAIAATTETIEASSRSATFGSIGTAVSFLVEDNVVHLTNTDSPDKRPDVTTEAGRAVVVEFLDAVNALFVEAIGNGRGLTPEAVTENFGRGASFLADEAKRRGMVDSVARPVLRAVSETLTKATAESVAGSKRKMDLVQLRSEHPDVYEAAVGLGRAQERDRVCAHLRLGEQSGAIAIAFTAVREGSEMTQSLTAEYLAAGIARSEQAARQTDSDEAANALAAANTQTEAATFEEQVVARYEELQGVTHG